MIATVSASVTESLTEIAALLRERSIAVDRAQAFPAANWRLLAEAGITGLAVPEEYGGHGANILDRLRVFHAIGAACPSTGLCLLMHSCATSVIAAMAPDAARARYLPRIARGELTVAYAGTERGTGTNFWALESHAERASSGYRLRIRKTWATLAEAADLFLIPTRDHPGAPPTEISLFLVERAEGVHSLEPWRGTGMRGSSSGPVDVDAMVPFDRLLGEPGRANEYITTDMFNLLLVSHAALYAGIAEEGLRVAAKHAGRRVFPHTGEALCDTSLWQCRIGELSAEVQSSVALTEVAGREASGVGARGRLLKSALAAKITACSLARRATDFAMQISGGSGYNTGERVELLWRDARAGSVMRPSDEVAQIILGRMECGLEPL